MTQDHRTVSVAGILEAMADELAILSTRADEVEHAVSPLINTPQAMPCDAIQHVQGLDQIRQELADLAILAQSLAMAVPQTELTPAQIKGIAAPLKLDRTRSLLDQQPDPSGKDGSSTDVHLF